MSDIKTLLEIMKALRDPKNGCPWDLEQTFETIAPYTLEEAYEVVDAIENSDMPGLKDELGDLLLQVVFHAQMASEKAEFEFDDVVEAICSKMTRRHPHVFGSENTPVTTDDVRKTWEQVKREERGGAASVLDGVPRALPALKRAQKFGSRASGLGFDWPDRQGAVDKVDEELAEFKEVMLSGDKASMEEELGDLMFSVVNVCRHSGVDAETALSKASAKFQRRFTVVEKTIKASETPLVLDELEAAWQSAKGSESDD